MADNTERYRLVVLGSGQVGKTSLIRKYLHNKFPDRYKETVEDIYSRDFRIKGHLLPLDILDTNFHYPDMRRLSMSSANAFLLVFSVDNVVSFKDVCPHAYLSLFNLFIPFIRFFTFSAAPAWV